MATITLNVPDAQATRVIDAWCVYHNYQATIPDPNNPGSTIPNPESKQAFVKRGLAQTLKDVVRSVEANRDAEAARATASSKVDTEITVS